MYLLRKGAVIASLLVFSLLAAVFGSAAALDAMYGGRIQKGLIAGGVDIGGLLPDEAAEKLKNSLPPLEGAYLVVEGEGRSFYIEFADIEGSYDIEGMTAAAQKYSGGLRRAERLLHILRLRAEQKELPPVFSCNKEKLAQKISELKAAWDTPAKDAAVLWNSEKGVLIEEEIAGLEIDGPATLERVQKALECGRLCAQSVEHTRAPSVTASQLAGIDSLLAAYTTSFDAEAANRAHNITLASGKLNGSVVSPGETFSLNSRLGPRGEGEGYKPAPVFWEEGLGMDAGGGVCQVATTLYNAVLLAGLPVVEHHHHPQPVVYAPEGRDATIAGDYLDLKFLNNTPAPVYIASAVRGNRITVSLFGAGGGRAPAVDGYPRPELHPVLEK